MPSGDLHLKEDTLPPKGRRAETKQIQATLSLYRISLGVDIVEAHCYVVTTELMATKAFVNWVQDCQLCIKLFCTQLTKAYVAKMSCNHLLMMD